MKLVNFRHHNQHYIGAKLDNGICRFEDLSSMYKDLQMVDLIANLDSYKHKLEDFIKKDPAVIPEDEVEFLPVINRPGKILAIGLNYADHAAETGRPTPKVPMVFTKHSTAINCHKGDIHMPKVSDQLDYEGEMALVIGKKCRHVTQQQAPGVIAGFTICNDVSVRDWQMASPTFSMGKSFDTHCPLGPYLVTSDEVDPHNLSLKTYINGELRQDSCTDQLIFNCYVLIEHLTKAFTLEPGDVIVTGTPGGVGVVQRKFLQVGDRIRIEVEGLGALENTVIQEPDLQMH